MNPQSEIQLEKAAVGEYPPGEEWRGKVREAVSLLGSLEVEEWVKIYPIELSIVSKVRATAHTLVKAWEDPDDPATLVKLITRYDRNTKTFWMTIHTAGTEEDEDE